MNKLSSDKDIDRLVHNLLRSGWLLIRTKKHPIIQSPTGRRIAVPSSPGVKRAFKEFTTATWRIPLFTERVPAGFPSPAQDYIEQTLDLNEPCISHPAATFFVRVEGESEPG